jgi:hypothetical protein
MRERERKRAAALIPDEHGERERAAARILDEHRERERERERGERARIWSFGFSADS